jgi:hypothetical protein
MAKKPEDQHIHTVPPDLNVRAGWNVWLPEKASMRGPVCMMEGESKLTEEALGVRIANVYNLLVRRQVAAVSDID